MASIKQSVEALTDQSGDLVGLIYNINGWGSFSRLNGEWKMEAVSREEIESVPEEIADEEIFTSTNIDLSKAQELVELFDADKDVTQEEIDSEYAAPEEEE